MHLALKWISLSLLVSTGLPGIERAMAHHAFASEFDTQAPVKLKGRVTRLEWINPHSRVHIAAVQDDGTTVPWSIEGGTPNTLLRSGITRDSLKPGTEILVRGYQSKDRLCIPSCRASGKDVTFPDGRKLFMGSTGTGAPQDGFDP